MGNHRRKLVAVAVLALATLPAVALASGHARRSHHLVEHITGKQVAATNSIVSGTAVLTYSVTVTGSDGRGHGRFVNSELGLTAGASRGTITYSAGSVTIAGSYTVVKVALTGPVKVTTKGRFTHGTGRYKGVSGHFTGSGTVNLTTKVLTLTIKGTSSY